MVGMNPGGVLEMPILDFILRLRKGAKLEGANQQREKHNVCLELSV